MLVAFFGISLYFYDLELKKLAVFPEQNYQSEIGQKQNIKNPFEDLDLEAKAVYVFDIKNNKPVFAKNEVIQLPLASLTKIMTVVVAKEIMPEDEFKKTSDILDKALVGSSNEAASLLSLRASGFLDNGSFIDNMNKKAKELNLGQTYFLNETGLDISQDLSGAYGSASDVAMLMAYAVKNNEELFESTRYGQAGDNINTNISAASTSQLIASKTGFTDLAGGNLAIIFDAGFYHPVIIVVLGSSKDGRFSDMQKLVPVVYNYLIQNK